MRVVFVGAGEVTICSARVMVERGVEVVIIESKREVIDLMSEQIDCGFLHGDGSKPAILREANPKQTDMLFCLTDNDQANILASLVGRSLGYRRVITSIQDADFEPICLELGLQDTIVPSATIGRYLADLVSGIDTCELSSSIKGEARLFAFILNEPEIQSLEDLQLPDQAMAVCCYRGDEFQLVDSQTRFRVGDEIVVLTHSQNLLQLRQRWEPEFTSADPKESV
ncbi:MAG: TrkA family potassium uptake protein [Planctomycetales bacterium]|nr:TrkA family potassium uptake protein [Planctomycetales bacterium]